VHDAVRDGVDRRRRILERRDRRRTIAVVDDRELEARRARVDD